MFSEKVGHTDERPWGRYTILDQGEGFQVKRIEVMPGKRLSLQSHEKREEFWVVVRGKFSVQIGDDINEYGSGDIIKIGKGQKHRPECISDEMGVFIEIQRGEYLGEDDIVRYEDDFGRVG